MINPVVGMPQGAEWLIILAIVILVFGAAKLPALARSMGQSLRIFKAETKGLRDDDADAEAKPAELPPTQRIEEPDTQAAPEKQPGSGS